MHALRRVVSITVRRGTNRINPMGGPTRFLSSEVKHPKEEGKEPDSCDTPSAETFKSELATKEGQLKELKDSYLMALADMENLRQRTKRDISVAEQFSIQKFSKDIVSVADVLEMALASVNPSSKGSVSDAQSTPPPGTDASKKLADLLEGLSMTLEELHKVFAKHGVTIVDPLHQKFDPKIHNALYEIPTSEVDPGVVVAVQKKGYMLHQRVIRPAEVGVSRKP